MGKQLDKVDKALEIPKRSLSEDPEAKRAQWIDFRITEIKNGPSDVMGRRLQQMGTLMNSSGIAIPNEDKEFWEKAGAVMDLQSSMEGAKWWTAKMPTFEPVTIDAVNADSFEGKLLLAAIALIETELRITKNSDEILQELVNIVESKWLE